MQLAATLIAVVGSGLFLGLEGEVLAGEEAIALWELEQYFSLRGGGSAAIGGLICVIPNLLFALRLKLVAARRKASFQANFILGELFKVMLTVGLLVVIARGYPGAHWPSLLIGLALASQAVFLAFLKKN